MILLMLVGAAAMAATGGALPEPTPQLDLRAEPRWEGQTLVFPWSDPPLRLEPHWLVLPTGRRIPLTDLVELIALNGRVFAIRTGDSVAVGRFHGPDLLADDALDQLNGVLRERAVLADPADRDAARQALDRARPTKSRQSSDES